MVVLGWVLNRTLGYTRLSTLGLWHQLRGAGTKHSDDKGGMRKILKSGSQLRAVPFTDFSLKVKFLLFLLREHTSRD